MGERPSDAVKPLSNNANGVDVICVAEKSGMLRIDLLKGGRIFKGVYPDRGKVVIASYFRRCTTTPSFFDLSLSSAGRLLTTFYEDFFF